MSIGTKIKELRRKNDITQEQLAEYLGISAPAVSQWECEKSAPDISQLPILANIFDVTVDTLLEVNTDRKSKVIKDICESAKRLMADGQRNEVEIVLRDGLRKFPNSYKIMERLAEVLYINGKREEAMYMAEKVIDECVDIDTKSGAITTAMCVYSDLGKVEKALEIAHTMPANGRGYYLGNLYTGTQLAEFLRKSIVEEITYQLICMIRLARCSNGNGEFIHTTDDQLTIYKKVVTILETLFDDGDYNFAAQIGADSYYHMADIYANLKDMDNTLACLKAGTKFGIIFDNYPEDAVQTSLICRGAEYGGWLKNYPGHSYRGEMREWLSNDKYDFIRNDSRFVAIVDSLK
ncbi:MAG: helix-turn-helix transcriptional regulator [Ruminococcaceae bacterium]|nr:helix-turn-helix transcriptional regulator [Oscillospiraceae bacterium]